MCVPEASERASCTAFNLYQFCCWIYYSVRVFSTELVVKLSQNGYSWLDCPMRWGALDYTFSNVYFLTLFQTFCINHRKNAEYDLEQQMIRQLQPLSCQFHHCKSTLYVRFCLIWSGFPTVEHTHRLIIKFFVHGFDRYYELVYRPQI